MGLFVAAGTLWALVSLSLILPLVRAPSLLCRTAVALLALEFVTLLAWGYATQACITSRCGLGVELTHAAAFQDIPAFALVLVLAGLVHARRRRRVRG